MTRVHQSIRLSIPIPSTATNRKKAGIINPQLKKVEKPAFCFLLIIYITLLPVPEGNIVINGNEKIPAGHPALMATDGEAFATAPTFDAIALVLSAKSIDKPVEAQGPFVMNTRKELMEAFNDFSKGKSGFLEA